MQTMANNYFSHQDVISRNKLQACTVCDSKIIKVPMKRNFLLAYLKDLSK